MNLGQIQTSISYYLSYLVSAKDLLKTFLWDNLLYGKKEEKEGKCIDKYAQMTFTGRTSEKFWEVETDLKWESLTRASNQGKPLRVGKADVQGDLALGGGDHVGVGQAHLKLQVVLCIVAKTIPEMFYSGEKSKFSSLSPWMLTPSPVCGIFNRLFRVLRPLEHLKGGWVFKKFI